MRKIVIIISMVFIVSGLKAQVWPLMPKYYQPLDSTVLAENNKTGQSNNQSLMRLHNDKINYSVTVGSGFSSFTGNTSMLSSYIAPSINYQVNDKLFLSVDGVIMQNNFNGFENNNLPVQGYSYNSSVSNYGINSTAYYQLNDKFSIYGNAAYFENQSVFSNYQSNVYNNDYKSISIGMGYKVNDNLQFNFQYRYSDGLNPMFNNYSPFYNRGYHPYRSGYNMWGY